MKTTHALIKVCGLVAAAALVTGCAGLVDKPVSRTLYDFGPGAPGVPVPPATATTATLPPAAPMLASLALADIDAAGALDGSGVLYRLAYADSNQLRAYAQARWSAPPPVLVRQRLREILGRERAVLTMDESAVLARAGGAVPRTLRIELEEFSHLFSSEKESAGLLRMRATLMENTTAGEKLIGQRNITIQRPAATPDAAGGVRALAAATDAAAQEISQWLQQSR